MQFVQFMVEFLVQILCNPFNFWFNFRSDKWQSFARGPLRRGNWKCRRAEAQLCQTSHQWIFRKFNFSAWKEPSAEFQAFQEVISCDQRLGFCIFRFETYFWNALQDCFLRLFLFVLIRLNIFFLLDLFWENIYDRVKSNFENIGSSDLLFKVSVFVLRCIFGYYSHRSRKLARNLTIGQYFPIVAFQASEKDKFEIRF